MECRAYRFNSFLMSPSWAVYRVKNMVNVLLQILLCCIPSGEENLVED